MKQECEAKEHHLEAKRVATNVFSRGSKKHQNSGCNHNRESADGPGLELARQPAESVISHAKASQPQIQYEHSGQENGKSHQVERLNRGHAVLAVADEDEWRPA